MARGTYAALAVGWVLSMIYECVQSGGHIGAYFVLGVLGVTGCAILFVRDVTRGKGKPVHSLIFFSGAAFCALIFFIALDKAAERGSYVRFMPFFLVLFLYFLAAGVWTWRKEHS